MPYRGYYSLSLYRPQLRAEDGGRLYPPPPPPPVFSSLLIEAGKQYILRFYFLIICQLKAVKQ
jgi:hypothetical protein